MTDIFRGAPYFDDFDKTKNFVRVMFRPERSVQVRELNQIQSIFQNQITQFADHTFKNGSIVSNARSSMIECKYVTIEDISPTNGRNILDEYFVPGRLIVNSVSGVGARIVFYEKKTIADPAIIYVAYDNAGIDNTTFTFRPGDTLNIRDSSGATIYSCKVRCSDCPGSTYVDKFPSVGAGILHSIDAGTFYFNGHFIETKRAIVIADRYKQNIENYMIGFEISFDIITSDSDGGLVDNSTGMPNYGAAGADRLVASATLKKLAMSNKSPDNFIIITKVEAGKYSYVKSGSEYDELGDYIAKRTYEESGNYTVTKPIVKFIESKAAYDGDPLGWKVTGDENKYVAVVDPLIAYISGYRLESTAKSFIEMNKARHTKQLAGFAKTFDEKSFIRLKPIMSSSIYPNDPAGNTNLKIGTVEIYNGTIVGGLPNGTKIGECEFTDITREADLGIGLTIYRYTISEIRMIGSNKLSDGRVFYQSSYNFSADVVLETDGNVKVFNPDKLSLIWRLDKPNVKTLKDINDPNASSLQLVRKKLLYGKLDSAGSIKFAAGSNEFFLPYDPTKTIASLININNSIGPVSVSSPNVFITDGMTLNIVLGVGHAGKKISLLHDVMTVSAQEKTKTVKAQADTFTNKTFAEVISLSKSDIIRITKIIIGGVDYTTYYNLFNGQKDDSYVNGNIYPVQGKTIVGSYTITVSYEYYDHSGSGIYFNVDSYRANIDNLEINYNYEDIPHYIQSSGEQVNLGACLDFRPLILSGSIVGQSGSPSQNTAAFFDIEYYLARVDLLVATSAGEIKTIEGAPSENPRPPKVGSDMMPLYEIHLLPYTYKMTDIIFKYIENKRYTMMDIEKIDDRLDQIEYYTVLNLLEKTTEDMSIKDAAGLDRFKNGFIADNFYNFQAVDITNPEFKSAIDKKRRELRPSYTDRSHELILDENNSGGYHRLSTMICMPYDSVKVDSQPYATKHISINPYFMFNKKGKVVLSPSMDSWTDTTRIPELSVSIDTGVEAFSQLAAAGKLIQGTGKVNTDAIMNSISDAVVPPSLIGRDMGNIPAEPLINKQWGEWADRNSLIGGKVRNNNANNAVVDVIDGGKDAINGALVGRNGLFELTRKV